MISTPTLCRRVLSAGLVTAASLLSACGSSPATIISERTVTTTTAPADPAPVGATTTTVTQTRKQTP